MADAYDVVKGSLKLKGVADGGVKKKKKKKKNKALEEVAKQAKKYETRNSSGEEHEEEKEQQQQQEDKRTAAQKAFDQIQEQRAGERIVGKAGKTHRQRVEKFNEYLDDLTEHYDIPKVSWTK